MEKLSGSEMVIRSLEDEGVEFIFGYPGGAVLHIYDALFKSKSIPHILVRHEQAATHAADGYARATGKPGVVLVTSGPGATNAITGVATAYMDSIPMVVLSGQVATHLIGEDAFQETDMIGVSRPIVKHSFQVRRASDIPITIKKAFHLASTGRPGPVVIDIPKDLTKPDELFEYSYPETVKLRSYSPARRGHMGQIKKAVRCHVGALPIPYRTNEKFPTFFNLPDRDDCACPSPHGRTFPTALDPHFCNRYEIGQFAKWVNILGIHYIGVCCGANPMLIREVAESVGLKVPASKYREKMENHFMYGKNKRIPKHMTEYGDKA